VRRAIVPALAVLAVAGLIALEALTAGSGNAPRPAPPLPSSVLRPPRATLGKLRGKPALVDFWASWCDPCRKEAPELERFDRSLHGAVGLVGVDYTDGEASARAYLRRYG
jgi:cytochrome c biogenesis protein CcmG, thiol:disulfide interchange protein DsbE